MAFNFSWPSFSPEFIEQSRQLLNTALNKSNKPANIVDHIVVKELNMGTQAPELEILEIGELALDKFRGIFKLTYSGDAYLVLQTKVQANPMNNNKIESTSSYTRRGILAADQPLVVPMLLRLSNLKLRGIVVLVVSKQKGITLVFKNDPLERVDVSSTFDSVTSVQRFLQTEIEKRLRIMFQEDLPSIVHQLSLQKWLNNDRKNNNCNNNKKTLEKSNSPSRSSFTTSASSEQRGPFIDHHTNVFNDYFTESPVLPHETMSMPELGGGNGYFSPLSTPSSDLSVNTSPDSSFYAEDGYSMMGGDLESLDGFSAYSTYSNFGELFDKEKGLKAISQKYKGDQLLDSSRPRPSETSVAAQLATLMNSNHTISPYTRTLQHLTFRSYPHPINKKPANKRARSGL
ncbi:3922_t:CDS:2 [Ambispora gerdemannii]|uniref:Mitochondrial distribution and morphology protein 34 n=1 Tax=Ambispora gerdemannii TaxID=144530 RepID=A0A9N9FJ33_9GLOM|nr:3922_t:CDS:2 [Ambispora gerdemannii]